MVGGTLKLENFQPIQIGKLFFIHAVSFGYFEVIGDYCTDFSVSCNYLLTDKISGIILVLYVCCSFKCIISMFHIHILAEKVSLILLYVYWIVNMYFRHEYMLYVYMYKHVIVILCNNVFELFIIIFIINVFIIILREFCLLKRSTTYMQHSSQIYNMILNISISRQAVAMTHYT